MIEVDADDPDPMFPVARAVSAAFDVDVRRVLGALPAARAGAIEGVHQMRVGCRRLRSDLGTFKRLLDRNWSDPLRDELAWLGARLGASRDLDVLRSDFQNEAGQYVDYAALRPLFTTLDSRHALAQAALLDALGSRRFGDLQGALIAAARAPRIQKAAAGMPCRIALPPLVAAAWKALARAGRKLDQDDPDRTWHRVRILAKRARYAAEAVAPALGPTYTDFARAAERVQDVLGRHQDAVIAAAEVARVAIIEHADAGFQVAAARLIAHLHEIADTVRTEFPAAWRQLDRKAIRKAIEKPWSAGD